MALQTLLQTVEKQVAATESGPDYPDDDAIISVHRYGRVYRSAIKNVHEKLKISQSPNLDSCLIWKILAFSGRYPYFVDHEYLIKLGQKQQSASMQVGPNHIWNCLALNRWMGNMTSSTLLVHGTHESTEALHSFGAQMAAHLTKQARPVAYIGAGLWKAAKSPGSGSAMILDGPQLLRHIAIQVLRMRMISTAYPQMQDNDFLALVSSFSVSERGEEWFRILEYLVPFVPNLDIIIDVGLSHLSRDDLCPWPGYFQRLVESLDTRTHCVRILLISPHLLTDPSGKASVISVEGPSLELTPSPIPGRDASTLGVAESHVQDQDEAASVGVSMAPNQRLSRQSSDADSTVLDDEAQGRRGAKPKSRGDFKIAIFCAVPADAGIIDGLFDVRWDPDEFGKVAGDSNSYTLGQMMGLDVVLIHLAGIGKATAARAAATCCVSFPAIKLSLVVGVCGGVPLETTEDCFLGDVVISDALVQYDFGRQLPGKLARGTSHDNLGRQSPGIRSFLAKLQGRRALNDLHASTWSHLRDMQRSKAFRATAAYPGAHADTLYESSYVHRHREAASCPEWERTCGTGQGVCESARVASCEDLCCDAGNVIPRTRLQSHASVKPLIHFGAVASGDRVMMSGQDRDKIVSEEGVIAFEMEGAGVWDVFPCLIIKGIGNYADSHNYKAWHKYAAASAAACVMAFLELWSDEC